MGFGLDELFLLHLLAIGVLGVNRFKLLDTLLQAVGLLFFNCECLLALDSQLGLFIASSVKSRLFFVQRVSLGECFRLGFGFRVALG